MRSGNLENVKLKIQRIRLGLLKASGSHPLSLPTSCLVEVLRFSDDNYLWCITTDLSSLELNKTHNARVKLKFVRRDEGLFIKLTGRAEIIGAHIGVVHSEMKSTSHKHTPVMIKIKVEHADCFQKRSTSRYTSFLQSINHFATNKAFANRGI